jgi:hypothetical protein
MITQSPVFTVDLADPLDDPAAPPPTTNAHPDGGMARGGAALLPCDARACAPGVRDGIAHHAQDEWEKQISAMTLVVGDLERSKTFYREVFGLPPLEEEDLAVFGFKDMYVALRKDPAHQPPGREVLGPGAEGSRAVFHLG